MLPGQSILQVRVTATEKGVFRRAADVSGLTLSAWVRLAARRAAIADVKDAGEELSVPRRGRIVGAPPPSGTGDVSRETVPATEINADCPLCSRAGFNGHCQGCGYYRKVTPGSGSIDVGPPDNRRWSLDGTLLPQREAVEGALVDLKVNSLGGTDSTIAKGRPPAPTAKAADAWVEEEAAPFEGEE